MTDTTSTNLIMRFDAQHRLYIALFITAIAAFFAWGKVSVPAFVMLTWMVCAFCIIVMDWSIILSAHPREMRKIARLKDSSRFSILLFIITASCVSLFAIIFVLQSSKNGHNPHVTRQILLSIASVVISWWMLHTVFTMSYAHLYYTNTPDPDDGKDAVIGGLEFPGNESNPDYLDFVYFSFVIGMTFQVSDIEISSRVIRRITLLHAIISFAFNTAIVALSINVISGLIS